MANILVIDDDAQVRAVLREILEPEGHSVTEAPDGQVGVRICPEKHPELVITNIIMPEKDGLETIRELKRDYPDLKIIAISGCDNGDKKGYLSLAEAYGAAHTFEKPFDPDELRHCVSEMLA